MYRTICLMIRVVGLWIDLQNFNISTDICVVRAICQKGYTSCKESIATLSPTNDARMRD